MPGAFIRRLAATALLSVLAGCASPSRTPAITADQALAIATDIYRDRDALPAQYEPDVQWDRNHWVVALTPSETDEEGNPEYTLGGERMLFLDRYGQLIAILSGVRATPEETSRWEDNLRRMKKN